MPYFIISNSDGDTHVSQCTKEQVIRIVQEQTDPDEVENPIAFISEIENTDTNYWKNGILIIKGEIVTPKPVKIVTAWDIC